jgi:hypothetical protein
MFFEKLIVTEPFKKSSAFMEPQVSLCEILAFHSEDGGGITTELHNLGDGRLNFHYFVHKSPVLGPRSDSDASSLQTL